MVFVLSIFQSCSPEEVVLQNESLTKSRDYSFKKINFLELKKINNQAFIESAKLKNVVASDKNKTSNSTFNYDIDLQNIQYVKRANDDETFSFRIFQVPTATFQQNIIVEFKKNEEPQSYLVTYYLNKQVNQINNSNDFIRAIKSTSTVKIENQLKTHRTTSGGCLQVGYYEEVDACEGNLDTSPRCYNSDGTRATINVFKVIDSACSTGGGPTDFIPLASQWDFSNTSSSNPYSEYTGTTTGGSTAGGETTDLNIFLPNYFEGSDLSDPAVQNMLQINQFITTLYNSSNEIKGVIDNTEWLMAYTNYWIGTNGGLTSSNQIALTYAFNNIPTIFNQYYNNDYTPSQVANFKFSVFQFLLYHGEWLSNLDPQIQISILETITSFEQIEFVNGTINFMIENPEVTYFDYIKPPFIWKYIGDDGNTFNDLNPSKEPFFKFDPTDNYEKTYPKFTYLAKNLKTFVKNNPKVLEALKTYSGFSKQKILDDLTFGQGPVIKVEEMYGRYGFFNKNKGINTLHINASYVRGLESAYYENTREATAFLLAVTILHEFVHYSTNKNNISEGAYDFGKGFERDAFNVLIEYDNAGNVVIKFSNYF